MSPVDDMVRVSPFADNHAVSPFADILLRRDEARVTNHVPL